MRFARLTAAVLAAVATIAATGTIAPRDVASASDPRPNILLIMTDDQSYDSLAYMANVQALAKDGTEFTDNRANFPLCCPSRTTTMTGQYVHNHGVWGNSGPSGGYPSFAPTAGNSLPVWLQDAGYKTMMIGKFLNLYNHRVGVPPGWDRWRVYDKAATDYTDPRLVHEDGEVYQHDGYSSDVYRDIALDLIDESAGGKPWFMWLAFNAPHFGSPIDPDDSDLVVSSSPAERDRNSFDNLKAPTFGTAVFNEADVRDKPRHIRSLPRMGPTMVRAVNEAHSQQLETLQAVDDAVGDVKAELARTGQLDNTVIMFTTDNGFYYGEHRIKAGKQSPYTAASHLPLIVAGPGFDAGVTNGEPRLNTDLAPTFVELAGAEAGRDMDGVSLTQSTGEWRPLLMEGRIPGGSAGVKYRIRQYTTILTPRWMYARYRYNDGALGVEMYKLSKDADMLSNVRGDPRYAAKKRQLRAQMEGMAGYKV